MDARRCVPIAPPEVALAAYGSTLGIAAPAILPALAEAIATSVGWAQFPGVLLVTRSTPSPLLLVAGRFEADGLRWLEGQAHRLIHDLERLIYLDPEQVGQLVRRLARRLAEELGERLRTAELVAIPRGGRRVRDALARELGRPAAPADDRAGSERLRILIDDCALTGQRLREALGRHDGPVACATLVSPPPLRAALLAAEPGVAGFWSAGDLGGTGRHTPEGSGYWRGDISPLGFPWGEPRRWFRLDGAPERAWRLVPPAWCEKNAAAVGRLDVRTLPALEDGDPRILTCPLGDGAVLVAHLPAGRVYRFDALAAELWSGWRGGRAEGAMIDSIAHRYAVPRERVAADAASLAAAARAADLLP